MYEDRCDIYTWSVVEDFDRVAVEDGDDGAGKVGKRGIGTNKEDETCQE